MTRQCGLAEALFDLEVNEWISSQVFSGNRLLWTSISSSLWQHQYEYLLLRHGSIIIFRCQTRLNLMRDRKGKSPRGRRWRSTWATAIWFGHSNRSAVSFSTRISVELNSHENNCTEAEWLVYRHWERSVDQSNQRLTFIEIFACPECRRMKPSIDSSNLFPLSPFKIPSGVNLVSFIGVP